MKLILSGQPIDAATALAAGLVTEVAPHESALERALDLAAKIAEKFPVALQLAKRAVLAAHKTPLAAGGRSPPRWFPRRRRRAQAVKLSRSQYLTHG